MGMCTITATTEIRMEILQKYKKFAGDAVQLVEYLPNMSKALSLKSPTLNKPGVVAHSYRLSNQLQSEGSGVRRTAATNDINL